MAGMHSDNYELARSSAPQSIKDYSAFTDKQWNTKADLSGGVYQAQNSLIEFDLSNIYRSDGYSDVSDYYAVIPTCMVACAIAGNGVIQTAPTAGYALCSLKNNYQNLIHSVEMTLNGKTIHDHQSFVNIYSNFKMLSSMSPSDLKSNNTNFGMASELDNHRSMEFLSAAVTAATTGCSGFGITNNNPFDTAASMLQTIKQNDGKGNTALNQRINRIVDTTTNSSFNNLFGAGRIMTEDQLKAEYKPHYTVSSNVMYWFDYAIINLKYIVDAIAKIGLVKKAELKLKMYVNTGAINVKVFGGNTADTSYGAVTTTFANTCPMTVNLITGTAASPGGGFLAAVDSIVAGLYISKPPSSFNGGGANTVSLAGALSSPLTQCVLYHSNIKLDNQSDTEYANANRAKKIVYEKILYATSTGITIGGQIDKIITSSIKNPIAVVIIPYLAKNLTGGAISTALPFSQFESPYDTAPSTGAPLSLTNISITLGGIKVANEVLNYTFENFLHQVSLAETITSSDIGLNVGLINQEYWESNRIYYMDLARSRDIDKTVSRELIVKGKNSSNVPIDVVIFAVYLEEFNIDVVTGVVTM
jgi:hypothetical protein